MAPLSYPGWRKAGYKFLSVLRVHRCFRTENSATSILMMASVSNRQSETQRFPFQRGRPLSRDPAFHSSAKKPLVETLVLKGHGFSRAEKRRERIAALAAFSRIE
jgi:hypothetical protein